MADSASSWRRGKGDASSAKGGVPSDRTSKKSFAKASETGRHSSSKASSFAKNKFASSSAVLPNLPLPLHNAAYLKEEYYDVISDGRIKQMHLDNPKGPLQKYVSARGGKSPPFTTQEGFVGGGRSSTFRSTVQADPTRQIAGYGDARTAREAEKLAALDCILQLARKGLLWEKPSTRNANLDKKKEKEVKSTLTATLSDGSVVTTDRAKEFIDFYCAKFDFGKPDIKTSSNNQKVGGKTITKGWVVEMLIGGSTMGQGYGNNKKSALQALYVDVISYIERCDPELWKSFDRTVKPGTVPGNIPFVVFKVSEKIDGEVQSTYNSTLQSKLFYKRPRPAGSILESQPFATPEVQSRRLARHEQKRTSDVWKQEKSERLLRGLENYQIDEKVAKIRRQRTSLPVYQKASDVLVKIELNQISIIMAATGSGKTTQIPQILFDDYIMQKQGANCNIICTQPRRIAAISVAERVAQERGEPLGKTVGYQVRFESKAPQPDGSITFCTTGVFLRRLQSALSEEDGSNSFLDSVTHIVIDEVHERDLETDLLLVVLKKLFTERNRHGRRAIKLVLMSATIDPHIFCNYFASPTTGTPAPVVEIPGRSFPVERHFLEDVYEELDALRLPLQLGGWVWNEKNVRDYLDRELSRSGGINVTAPQKTLNDESKDFVDDLELPYPLIALIVAYVIQKSDDGHVLVFLPGWDEIKAIKMILEDTSTRHLLRYDFNDGELFEVHVLHSSIPVADQQAVFEPVRKSGIRRIILATNIAETSVTIPDVVYVIDTGRVKEARYDPERHLSSLVSAWVGTSNINQRAGRAGRHRPGEAYAVFSRARYDKLNVSSTVEMKRVDLSNVVMHIKALDIPGMDVIDVLQAAIEPPALERIEAAMEKLVMVGALDCEKNLTSLGRVLLQLPVDAPVGKMCLYGAFFRCLDPTLTLAAVLTNRDPWMAPPNLKDEAGTVKNSWTLQGLRSDALVTLRAYSRWDGMTKRGSLGEANRFCNDNFLGRITLGQIQQVKTHLFESMEKAGILDAILGSEPEKKNHPRSGPHRRVHRRRLEPTDVSLNANSWSAPMLAALIACASVPNFAVRAKQHVYRTSQDKSCVIHPSSVQHAKHTKIDENYQGEKELFAFSEKIKNTSGPGSSGGPTMLRNVTRLDPLTYMLFGANRLQPKMEGEMLCDNWLPIRGAKECMTNVEKLKAILDVCMLRVFEAIQPEGSNQDGKSNNNSRRLESREVIEFEELTSGIVRILDMSSKERNDASSSSRASTRPTTPSASGCSTPHSYKITNEGGIGLMR